MSGLHADMVDLWPFGSSCSSLSAFPLRPSAKIVAGMEATASVAANMAQEGFQVCKRFLHPTQIVDEAARIAGLMVEREARASGDIPNAMQRLERRHDLPPRTLWSLRYRRPKRMFADVYLNLVAAYRSECLRQQKALEHELATTAALAGSATPLVRAAAALAGAHVQPEA